MNFCLSRADVVPEKQTKSMHTTIDKRNGFLGHQVINLRIHEIKYIRFHVKMKIEDI